MLINLTDQEKIHAMKIGLERTIGDGKSERFLKDRRWNEHSHIADLVQSIHSAGSEIAVAKALKVEDFQLTVHTFKKPDIEPDIQVRWTNRHKNLIVRPADDNYEVYILVTGELDAGYQIQGWMRGYEAKQDSYLSNPANRGQAWFIPSEHLHQLVV